MLALADEPAVWVVVLVLAIAAVVLLLSRLGVSYRQYHARLSERWIHGVPWGSLIVVLGLLAVYLFVQRGWWHWHRPVVVGFTAAAMWDPAGWLFAGFSHVDPGHLRNNLTSTLVFAPIVEWIWGHYPRRPSSRPWLDRPGIRAVIVFPGGVALLGIVAALSSWGPVIGFSVAVYALVGVVLVHYPLFAVVGLVARTAVRLAWRTVTDPVQVSRTSVQVVEPSWYGSAVQGHLVGLLIGVLVGLWLYRVTAERRPDPARLFAGTVFVGTYLSVWAIWWILGPDRFVLFRALGVILVLGVAAVLVLAVVEPPIPEWRPGRLALGCILLLVIGMGVVGVGLNLVPVEVPEDEPTTGVADYDIYYGERIPDGMVNVFEVEAFGLTTDVRTSGVVVVSERRNVWRQTASATELETHGFARFHVGGLGWSEEVIALRRGWVPVGNDSVYAVWIGDGDRYDRAFAAPPRAASAVVDDHSFVLGVAEEEFAIRVERAGEAETVPFPTEEDPQPVLGVELYRDGDVILARTDGDEVPIATRETYE